MDEHADRAPWPERCNRTVNGTTAAAKNNPAPYVVILEERKRGPFAMPQIWTKALGDGAR